MKSARLCSGHALAGLLLILLFSAQSFGQGVQTLRSNVAINSNCNGYIEYLPDGYNTSTKRYPLLIFFMGINSDGPGTDSSLQTYFGTGGGFIQDQIAAGQWPDSFTVNGQTHQFVIITPQFITDYNDRPPTPEEVNDVLDYMIQHYRIDTTRIYLTGNSSGGGPVWDYPAASSEYANRIAAIVPFCGVVFPSQEKADKIKFADIAVWAFHNEFDDGVPVTFTTNMISMINKPPAPTPLAKATIFPNTGHDCWWRAYMRVYEEDTLNIYEWMLQFARTITPVNAGIDQDITLPVNSAQLTGSGTGPNGTTASYSWQKIYGPSQGSISNAAIANPVLNNLAVGTYIYRLTITDNSGGSAYDDVAIVVYPERIEAENYSAMSGVSVNPSPDGGNEVTGINQGDWMDYSINVPSTGTYIIRFRTTGWYWGQQFQVKNSGGTVLTTVNVIYTQHWETYATLSSTIQLNAGPQTIRLEGITGNEFRINWLQLIEAGNNAPLPVNFELFNARCMNGSTSLTWKTAGERNTSNFSIEKSSNGRDWSSIATVPAAGQSNSTQSYYYTDPAGGYNSLYRIVANDADGKKAISSIIRNNCSGNTTFAVYPNPVSDKAVLYITVLDKARLQLYIADIKGAVVRRLQKEVPEGTSQLSIDMSGLSNGNYTLVAEWGNERKSVKMVKK